MNEQPNRWTADLLLVGISTVLATGVVLLGIDGSPLRTALVAPLVVFLPGYAFVAVLFPERHRPDPSPRRDREPVSAPAAAGDGISVTARIGLATALSIAIVPAIALVYNFTPVGLDPVATILTLAALTLALTVLALGRRWRLSPEARFALPTFTTFATALVTPFRLSPRTLSPSDTFAPTSRRGHALNVVLALSVVVLLSSVAVAFVAPPTEEPFTEFYLVTESDNGTFVAENYPRQFASGETQPVYMTIANHEGDDQSYTVVVELQRVDQTPDGTAITQEAELQRVDRTVRADERVRIRHDLQPTFSGSRLRVQYLLYVGDPPDEPTRENAYRYVQLWVSVDGTPERSLTESGV